MGSIIIQSILQPDKQMLVAEIQMTTLPRLYDLYQLLFHGCLQPSCTFLTAVDWWADMPSLKADVRWNLAAIIWALGAIAAVERLIPRLNLVAYLTSALMAIAHNLYQLALHPNDGLPRRFYIALASWLLYHLLPLLFEDDDSEVEEEEEGA